MNYFRINIFSLKIFFILFAISIYKNIIFLKFNQMSGNYETFDTVKEQKELGGGKIVYNFCPGPCILP
jgi:hypothetical protein